MTREEVEAIIEQYCYQPTVYGISRTDASIQQYCFAPSPFGVSRTDIEIAEYLKKFPLAGGGGVSEQRVREIVRATNLMPPA
jgi:hypothetical protein